MKSFSDIIETIKDIKKLKQNKDVAKLLNINYRTFCTQKRRNSIPHDKLISFCSTENISTDELFGNNNIQLKTDLLQVGKETKPISYSHPNKEETYRQICADCEYLCLEDQKSILALISIFTSDDEETKLAIRQNIKQFKKLVSVLPPPEPERNTYLPRVKGLSPPAGMKRGKQR